MDSGRFDRISRAISSAAGSPWAFGGAFATVATWAALGPLLAFSSGWQLAINTGTTIVTFLMVFVIQRSQNRDTAALHAKLDVLIGALPEADDALQRVEERSADEIERRRPGEPTPPE